MSGWIMAMRYIQAIGDKPALLREGGEASSPPSPSAPTPNGTLGEGMFKSFHTLERLHV
jgi:hypothetical protein